MMPARVALLSCFSLAWLTANLGAEPPSYGKQVKPFLAKYCFECHNATSAKSDLNLETFEGLLQGGKRGPVVVLGKPDESRLVLLPEGRGKPAMPPKKAKQPPPDEVALLRSWVAAGAKNDVAITIIVLPAIKPHVQRPAPIAALAYRPDGKLLAAGQDREVIFLDPGTGDLLGKLNKLEGRITSVTFSPDGRRLAVVCSTPGTRGAVYLYPLGRTLFTATPGQVLVGHQDAILDTAFTPDGTILATAGYDRLIELWDSATGKELRTLKDHSDAVYGVAFSPDGRLLASAAADRAVKVWDVATGTRLYTLGESTDWVYAVAWSPDGRHLAAAGVDRSIRVWEVTPAGGKIVQSVFAHEAPITRLVYSADGKTLYSLSEDRTIKSWNTVQMVERKVYAKQPEVALAFAVRPDHKQLALGRYDGRLILLDEATGLVQAEPLPIKPKPPVLTRISPAFGQRGRSLRLTFEGKHLGAPELVSIYPAVAAKLVPTDASTNTVQMDVAFPASTPAGVYKLGIKTPAGQSAQLPFIVDLFSAIEQRGTNDSLKTGQKIDLPATVVGTIDRAGRVDFYRFEAKAGQEIGAQVLTAGIGSKLEPVLQILTGDGQVLGTSYNGLLGYTSILTGTYFLAIRDREYRGGPDRHYRVHIGEIPVITSVFPLGLQRGTETEIEVDGVNLGSLHSVRLKMSAPQEQAREVEIPLCSRQSVRLKAPADAAVGSRLTVRVQTPHGPPLGEASVVVGEFPQSVAPEPGKMPAFSHGSFLLAVPGTANGRITHPATASQLWHFSAKKGQRLIIEVNAHRLGSPLDSYIEVFDAKGQPVPRAVLRCGAKTYVTFRDHDSVGANVRLESWNELAIDDYIWAGSELLRIWALPKGPDDDCLFWSTSGQRLGYLDTTPKHLSLGMPMYKVSIHPPGTNFPPNGFPVIPLAYYNDDGGPGFGKDSRLFFDPPADGEYRVLIGDTRGEHGRNYVYRLTIRPPRPSFDVTFTPTAPSVWKGGAVPITVSADRHDGFDGPIEVWFANLPGGFSAPRTTIPARENSTAFALGVDVNAKKPANIPPLKLVARAVIDGKEMVREAVGGKPNVIDPGELVTTTERSEVTVHPGQQVFLTAKIDRRNGFTGRVPLDVLGLPHGVRVLDIGLNGILITEKETARTFAIYAEPWVQPTTHPFVVLARHEGKGKDYAAKSVLLRVAEVKK